MLKNPPANAEDVSAASSVPGFGRFMPEMTLHVPQIIV